MHHHMHTQCKGVHVSVKRSWQWKSFTVSFIGVTEPSELSSLLIRQIAQRRTWPAKRQASCGAGRQRDRQGGREAGRRAKKQTGILALTFNSPWRKTEIYLPFQQQETVHVLLNSNILILDLNRNINGEKASQFSAYFLKHLLLLLLLFKVFS